MSVAALIVAAGRGVRAGGDLPKQYRRVKGQTILWHTVNQFISHEGVDHIQVAIHPDDHAYYENALGTLLQNAKLLPPTHGGATRQESVLLGLLELRKVAPDTVMIHDAARPFVSADLISRLIAHNAEGAIAALPVVDTLKRAEGGALIETVDRTGLWRAQTPQAFRFSALLAAHENARGENLTDDAAVAQTAGLKVVIVEGDADNFKLTTEADFKMAEQLMTQGNLETRIGQGFDVHRFDDGDSVTLCGIVIPHDQGLKGHSDADVGLHALTDALLGAIGEGDIGAHFPPSEEKWRGAPSHVFLAHAADLVSQRQGRILNVDITLICEAPKISSHRTEMREKIAQILAIESDRVSVKATTTERLGFTGRGEGIAAQAIAAVEIPHD